MEGLRQDYEHWYSTAGELLPDDLKDSFREAYEGKGLFSHKIKDFLADPTAPNFFKLGSTATDPLTESLLRWQHPYREGFQSLVETQRQLLMRAQSRLGVSTKVEQVLEELEAISRRLPSFLRLINEARNNATKVAVTNEADLQDVLHSILRLHFDDVRPEEYSPSRAGRSARPDFLLSEVGILIETKMTRKGLSDKKVGDELLEDVGRYPEHPDCQGIFALIYDPGHFIKTPAALERDLPKSSSFPTRVVVVR